MMKSYQLYGSVVRIAPDGREKVFEVKTKEVADYLASLQDSGFSYKKADTDDGVCTSCEG